MKYSPPTKWRWLACIGILVAYLFVLRPLRITITEHWIYPQVKHLSTEMNKDHYREAFNEGAIHIQYIFIDKSKELYYRPNFGFYFMVALIGLTIIGSREKGYKWLVTLHLVSTVTTYLLVLTGILGFSVGFIFVDMISGYLTPAFSLALLPWMMFIEANPYS